KNQDIYFIVNKLIFRGYLDCFLFNLFKLSRNGFGLLSIWALSNVITTSAKSRCGRGAISLVALYNN
ncbi:MAG: hypothetical protein MJZ99_09205, partial [Bacteroidales bacterium]|nr:hypothetical protein [Bacteroidales bacterium]